MKWVNKGHEYDIVAEKYLNDEELFIYGAGDCGKGLYDLLRKLDIKVSFIDGNRQKQLQGCMGEKVISPIELFEYEKKKNIIIAVTPQYYAEIKTLLEEHGYKSEEDFWSMEDFCQNQLPIYMAYVKRKLYMNSVGFLSTTVCNLCCEACLNFTPYNKNPEHMDLNSAKKTLDDYFNAIDFVNLFSYTGGEPLLFPYIDELLTYIGDNYNKKIYKLGMSTNCTLLPKDSTCEILRKYNFHVFIDDYSEYVDISKKVLPKLMEKLNKFGISYAVNSGKEAYWIDLAPLETDNTGMSEEQLIVYKTKCNVPFRELRNSRLYACNYASFAMKAGLQKDNKNDWYDLSAYTIESQKELLEFIMGYNEKGYVDFCKHCAGFLPINPYKKPVGRQISRNT